MTLVPLVTETQHLSPKQKSSTKEHYKTKAPYFEWLSTWSKTPFFSLVGCLLSFRILSLMCWFVKTPLKQESIFLWTIVYFPIMLSSIDASYDWVFPWHLPWFSWDPNRWHLMSDFWLWERRWKKKIPVSLCFWILESIAHSGHIFINHMVIIKARGRCLIIS